MNEQNKEIFISRKESKFDFVALEQLGNWYNQLDIKQKQVIGSRLKDENKKLEILGQQNTNLALFNTVTLLPQDLQHIIVAHMFGRKLPPAATFCKMPLCNAFNCYGRAEKILERKKHETPFNKCLSKDLKFTLDVIFENVKELNDFAIIIQKKDEDTYSFKELKSIAKIARIFESFSTNYQEESYQHNCYEPFTLDNFKNQYNREQWRFLTFLLAPFASRLIAKDYVYKNFDQSIIDINRNADYFNRTLAEKVKNVEDPFWLQFMQPIKETYVDHWNNSILLEKILVYWSALPISFPFWDKDPRYQSVKPVFSEACVLGCIPGFVTWVIKSIVLYAMPMLIEPLLERPLMSMACITGLYAFIVSLYNVKKMRTTRPKTVELKDLAELLKRTDIIIE